jgi:hypothetical protein
LDHQLLVQLLGLMKLGLDNIYIPFRGRRVHPAKQVRLHRNLHSRQNPRKKYSIMQGGLVVGHTSQFMLRKCSFIVRPAGRKRVLETKRKNVHAFVFGFVAMEGGMGTTAADARGLPAKITYNPYKFDSFVCENLTQEPYRVITASVTVFRPEGVSAAYTD